jgi:hypothetical protein
MYQNTQLDYLKANPLAEHNSGIALSSNQIPTGGSGNMYDGQAGRAFVQGGGNGGSYYGFGGVENGEKYANGSYAPVLVGSNADANALSPSLRISGGGAGSRKKRNTKKGSKKQSHRYKRNYKKYKGAGSRSRSRSRTHNNKGRFRGRRYMKTLRNKVLNQHGGDGSGMVVGWGAPNGSSLSEPNAAYSIGGTVSPQTTALATPAQPTHYNSCHPVK